MGGGADAGPAAAPKFGQDIFLVIGVLMKPNVFYAALLSSSVLGLVGTSWPELEENMVAFEQSHSAFCSSDFPKVRLKRSLRAQQLLAVTASVAHGACQVERTVITGTEGKCA